MDRAKKMFVAGLSLASMAVAAVPAEAQYYPPPPRGGGIAGEIARGAGRAAEAVGAIENAVRGAMYGYGYQGSRERYAVQACGYRAERYGQVRIDYVEPYKRRSWRITGTADPRARLDDRRYGYSSSRYAPRSFTCVVRDDGRVTKFSTRRIRY